MCVDELLNKLTLEEKASLCSGADFWNTQDIERLGIPRVMVCDATHGLRKQLGEGDHLGINESIQAVSFPTAATIACSFDEDLVYDFGQTMGQECNDEKVGMLLGPGVNIKRSPLCGRNFEYFSEDPYLTAKLATAYVNGIQKQGVAACAKHFAANNQETRRMSGNSVVDERTLNEIYFPAFESMVKNANLKAVMCAYNALNGTFCAENKHLLNDVLRDKWGFNGLVVTDWGAVKNRVKGLLAGLDLEMPGGTGTQDAKIVEAVLNGTISEAVLNKAAKNILQFIIDSTENQKQHVASGINFEKDRAKSLEYAKESAVLLKNNNVLPISKWKKVAFIGEFAAAPRYQGAGSSHVNTKIVTNALDAAKEYSVQYAKGYNSKDSHTDIALLTEAVELAKTMHTAVLFVGLPDAFETEGADRTFLELPQNQIELINAIAAVQPKTVVVLHSGSAVTMQWEHNVASILQMYLAGDGVGAASVDLLFGKANPSGKLAETFPLRLEDTSAYLNFPGDDGTVTYHEGVFVGYRYYDKLNIKVQYPFGHGLSYTEFAYSNIKLSTENILDTDNLNVTCDIKNIGNCNGKEVVQLYVGAIAPKISRPNLELKGFTKVELQAGEEKQVKFTLDKRSFAYYDSAIHDWIVETGNFELKIGSSSRDLRLETQVHVTSTASVPINITRYSTMGEVMCTTKGKELVMGILSQKNESQLNEGQDAFLGEGSEKRIETMIKEMPLSSLVTFGKMTDAQLEEFLANINN